jgi:glutamate:GABA antiporter
MAAREERVMISEQIAPGLLPRVLNSFDMVAIFVAIVLFIVQSSVLQAAGGPIAFTYLVAGFLLFLIPGALITAQLGLMFPEEGSLYVWTHKALGPFWGFFAGFCAWWPGIIVMVVTGDTVVILSRAINPNVFTKTWEEGLVAIAVIVFSGILSVMRFRMTQNYVNLQFVFYAAAIFVIGLAGVVWLAGGHPAANSFAADRFFDFKYGNYTFFGFVILALLGIEVPLNMGVEIVHPGAIKKYLFWGSIVVMAAYLWTTWGQMVVFPTSVSASQFGATGAIPTVQRAISHPLGTLVGFILIWFFVSNTVVYNYSFARLLFVSGLERRLPSWLGRVNPRTKVPANAVITQTVIASLLALGIFVLAGGGHDLGTKVYLAGQGATTVIWCLSMVLLFLDIFFVRQWFPQKFEEVRTTPRGLLNASGIVGALASAFGAYVVFTAPFGPVFRTGEWRLWVGILTGVSALMAVLIYVVSQAARRGRPRATPAAPAPAVGAG